MVVSSCLPLQCMLLCDLMRPELFWRRGSGRSRPACGSRERHSAFSTFASLHGSIDVQAPKSHCHRIDCLFISRDTSHAAILTCWPRLTIQPTSARRSGAASNMTFPLLQLPAELRLRIYDYMLNPASAATGRTIKTRINWLYCHQTCQVFIKRRAHEISSTDLGTCGCKHLGSPWLPGPPSHISPGILAANRFVYVEALPRLYERRLWEAVNFRTFGTSHEACLERWWIMDSFLARLGSEARRYVTAIGVPMLISPFEVDGCADAFASMQARLPSLRSVDVHPLLVGELLERNLRSSSATWSGKSSSLVWPTMRFDCAVQFVITPSRSTTEYGSEQMKDFCAAQQIKVDEMKEKRRRRAYLQTHEVQRSDDTDALVDVRMLWQAT